MPRKKPTALGDATPAEPTSRTPVLTSPAATIVDRPLTPKQLANFLQVSPATIRRRLNEIPHMTVGKRIRFMPQDVIEHFRSKYQRKPDK